MYGFMWIGFMYVCMFMCLYIMHGCCFAFSFLNKFLTILFMKTLRDKFGKQLSNQVIDLNLKLHKKTSKHLFLYI